VVPLAVGDPSASATRLHRHQLGLPLGQRRDRHRRRNAGRAWVERAVGDVQAGVSEVDDATP
jgi:hypothetical protein